MFSKRIGWGGIWIGNSPREHVNSLLLAGGIMERVIKSDPQLRLKYYDCYSSMDSDFFLYRDEINPTISGLWIGKRHLVCLFTCIQEKPSRYISFRGGRAIPNRPPPSTSSWSDEYLAQFPFPLKRLRCSCAHLHITIIRVPINCHIFSIAKVSNTRYSTYE